MHTEKKKSNLTQFEVNRATRDSQFQEENCLFWSSDIFF